jgi:hypothetical protein
VTGNEAAFGRVDVPDEVVCAISCAVYSGGMNALRVAVSLAAALATVGVSAQELDFRAAERRFARLPPAAFPMLPVSVVRELQRRGCTIPQEDYSKRPNNVISGQFSHRGQRDWAVLCSRNGESSILVFWKGSASNPAELARSEDINSLQGGGSDKILFSRGISAVGSDFILKHYQAYGGPRPPRIDHEGIDDAFIEKASVVQYFYEGNWLQLTGSD